MSDGRTVWVCSWLDLCLLFNGKGVLHIWFHSGSRSVGGLQSFQNPVQQGWAMYQAELSSIEKMQLSLH